jgi:glycogen debranching enzyme
MDYRVIKENDLFLTTNPNGDIPHNNPTGLGLYTKDTRYLSRIEFRINGKLPILLTSQADENFLMTFLLTNEPGDDSEKLPLWRESIELKRKRFIYDGVLYESATFPLGTFFFI